MTPSVPGFNSTTHAKRHKILLVRSLPTVTTYPTFTSWKLAFGFLQCSLRYPDQKASLGSGVDFAEISAFSLVNMHLRTHSLVLPPYGHLGERRKELSVSDSSGNMYVKGLAYTTTSQPHRCVASYWYMRQALPKILSGCCLMTFINIHTYTHACIQWIHKCVTETGGYGTSHTYIKRKIYSANYYKHFRKTVLQICFAH